MYEVFKTRGADQSDIHVLHDVITNKAKYVIEDIQNNRCIQYCFNV
jgi:hypothetical protein